MNPEILKTVAQPHPDSLANGAVRKVVFVFITLDLFEGKWIPISFSLSLPFLKFM